MRISCVFLVFAALLAAQQEVRQGSAPAAGTPAAAAQAERKPVEEKSSRTEHTVRISGREIRYTATAGTLNLKKEDGTVTASIFYIAYTKNDVAEIARRPITFSFNGGPGSSSVWLHLGALGPRRVVMTPEGRPTPPPYRLVDNEFSILDATDLVFIDPVSTGYSRAANEQEARNFHGAAPDVQSVAEFIRLYTSRNARWASPKLLVGESYGTTRAAALSGYLQSSLGMNLNGIMLISSVLNFATLSFDTGNDLPYVLFLPSYTATAWYHKKLPEDLQADRSKALEEAEKFALGEYNTALMKGSGLSPREQTEVAKRVARLTGLSPRFVEMSNLRVPMQAFAKELLRDRRRSVGRFDSRLEGIDASGTTATPDYDPSYAAVQGPYTGAMNQYVRAELRFESDLPYEILTGRVRPWSFGDYQNRYMNVAEALRQAMTQNPNLAVYVGNGYYDLATPYFATVYTFSHLGLDPSLRGNVSMGYYDAGHMMYVHHESLAKMRRELAGFIAKVAP